MCVAASNAPYVPLLSWKKAQDSVPWNIIMLLGGGFAMAKACEVTLFSVAFKNEKTQITVLQKPNESGLTHKSRQVKITDITRFFFPPNGLQ